MSSARITNENVWGWRKPPEGPDYTEPIMTRAIPSPASRALLGGGPTIHSTRSGPQARAEGIAKRLEAGTRGSRVIARPGARTVAARAASRGAGIEGETPIKQGSSVSADALPRAEDRVRSLFYRSWDPPIKPAHRRMKRERYTNIGTPPF